MQRLAFFLPVRKRVMGNKVEMLTLLNAARTMKWEQKPSSGGPSREQILGAVGSAQRANPLGIALIYAKHLHDAHALSLLTHHMTESVEFAAPIARSGVSLEFIEVEYLAHLVLADITSRLVESQRRRVESAWKRYSMRGERSKKTIQSLSKSLRSLERARETRTAQAGIAEITKQINSLESRIEAERQSIAEYARNKAEETLNCPKCKATGTIQKTQTPCDICGGVGSFRLKDDELKRSFLSEFRSQRDSWPKISGIAASWRDLLFEYEKEAQSLLDKRLSAEYDHAEDRVS
ncbi:hypothetical protein ETS23_21010 [Vibrio parahaemolyticus]|nr:hypothetical protein [Vibrio parahaemolyticus]